MQTQLFEYVNLKLITTGSKAVLLITHRLVLHYTKPMQVLENLKLQAYLIKNKKPSGDKGHPHI